MWRSVRIIKMSLGTMTAARRQRKARPFLGCLGLVCAGLWGIAAFAADEPLVINPNTGLAISGFDPVAYFTDGKPTFGRAELELRLDGAIWRFRNEGDRAAFVEHPDIYTPRFGGYDPVSIANGKSVPGHPLFWAVSGQRLYLFYSDEARTMFLADPDRIISRATHKWPELARTIGR